MRGWKARVNSSSRQCVRGKEPPEQCARSPLNSTQARKKKNMQNETRSALPHLQLFKLRIAHAAPHAESPGGGRKRPPGPPDPDGRPRPGQGRAEPRRPQVAAKRRLFGVELLAVKANGGLLCQQAFLKAQNILELICELGGVGGFFVFHRVG